MREQMLSLFMEFLEKQDILNKLTEQQKLNEFGYSEIHTIKAIHEMEFPNVTEISKRLRMTRGAISKIAKKLIARELIETYSVKDNKQKIFFRLTEAGQVLYEAHEQRHMQWEKQFFAEFSSSQLEEVIDFMDAYNRYLESQIKELEENRK